MYNENSISDNNNDDVESNNLQSIIISSSCFPITLKFMDLCYRVKIERKGSSIKSIFFTDKHDAPSDQSPQTSKERTILNGITGMVSPGEVLAVLGPSGSGKSTLLSALAGRLPVSQNCLLTGTILSNNRKLCKKMSKQIGYVAQEDVLYPHLTVRETLIFCSLLRLPRNSKKIEKIAMAESVISELGLRKCENTIIGNSVIRGISGGERKRVSIGHEMLMNPSLLIMDEPTSGLDSTAAYRVVKTIKRLASEKGKTVVTSLHQPSSRVYQMMDKVMVLSEEGRCLYYGKGDRVINYFQSLGFIASFPMNPADFLLDLANGIFQLDGTGERDKSIVNQILVSSYNNLLASEVKSICVDISQIVHSNSNKCREISNDNGRLSSWLYQFSILLQRSLKERKHETLNYLRVFQVIAAALLSGLMWWHSDYRDVQDRLGLLFFIAIFWGVFPSFNSVFVFPQERSIFVKERASGMYTLSSYFMARIIGDIPMDLILPTTFLLISYWMAGLKPELGAFILTLLVVLGYVLVSQGLGLFLGAVIMDVKQASTVVTITMLAFVLTGGYYIQKVASCITWFKYVSTTFYGYQLLIHVQYGDGKEVSSILGCYHNHGSKMVSCKFVEEDVRGKISPFVSVAVLFIMFLGYRLLAYLALRHIRPRF